jgi:hypothetical protein
MVDSQTPYINKRKKKKKKEKRRRKEIKKIGPKRIRAEN